MKLSELKDLESKGRRSWVFYANFLLFQWFCIRLARVFNEGSDEQVGWTWLIRMPLAGWDEE